MDLESSYGGMSVRVPLSEKFSGDLWKLGRKLPCKIALKPALNPRGEFHLHLSRVANGWVLYRSVLAV